MRSRLASAALVGLLLPVLASCTANAPSDEEPAASTSAPATTSAPSPSESTPAEDAGAVTIEDVWADLDCSESPSDPSFGRIQDGPPRQGSCSPAGGDGMAFFYELGSPAEAQQYASGNGALEVGPTDAVFVDGSVVILTSDNFLADDLAERYELVS